MTKGILHIPTRAKELNPVPGFLGFVCTRTLRHPVRWFLFRFPWSLSSELTCVLVTRYSNKRNEGSSLP